MSIVNNTQDGDSSTIPLLNKQVFPVLSQRFGVICVFDRFSIDTPPADSVSFTIILPLDVYEYECDLNIQLNH